MIMLIPRPTIWLCWSLEGGSCDTACSGLLILHLSIAIRSVMIEMCGMLWVSESESILEVRPLSSLLQFELQASTSISTLTGHVKDLRRQQTASTDSDSLT
ncbi:hypothetical protein EV363DRAFT_755601 [Boletus edulis]|uniref:Uncharacterized protein n=1 Tax=Boletus edulis BED1 TaxID=1328754 RepID=A0AAD4BCF7_BOLED|nr:hypothetical protein EV363DRAFT_755601 [Boletus edulis]KAF8417539.1 hypothetical protein L210DRAFT_2473342 [Boletus edulis BED1]